jgi:hypothetical protein
MCLCNIYGIGDILDAFDYKNIIDDDSFISNNEREIIKACRTLDEHGRKIVGCVLHEESAKCHKKDLKIYIISNYF